MYKCKSTAYNDSIEELILHTCEIRDEMELRRSKESAEIMINI